MVMTLLRLLWLLLTETKTKKNKEGDEEEEEEEEEEIRDPKIKLAALEEEKSRHWRRAKKLEKQVTELSDRIKELEEGTDDGLNDALRSSRLETAFLRAVLEHREAIDVETMWTLGNSKGFLDTVKVNDDGEVEGMSEALEKVLDRYPWLAEEPSSDSASASDGLLGRRTASPPKKPKEASGQQVSNSQLKDRFPALKRHR